MRVKNLPHEIKIMLNNEHIHLHRYNKKIIEDTDMLFYLEISSWHKNKNFVCINQILVCSNIFRDKKVYS